MRAIKIVFSFCLTLILSLPADCGSLGPVNSSKGGQVGSGHPGCINEIFDGLYILIKVKDNPTSSFTLPASYPKMYLTIKSSGETIWVSSEVNTFHKNGEVCNGWDIYSTPIDIPESTIEELLNPCGNNVTYAIAYEVSTYDIDNAEYVSYPNDYEFWGECELKKPLIIYDMSCCENSISLDLIYGEFESNTSSDDPEDGGKKRGDFKNNSDNRSVPNFINSIYPNPFTNSFKLVESDEQISQINVIDINGRLVYNSEENINRISTEDWKSGIYFVHIFNGVEWKTQKVMKIE